ncbi:MAG: hypothetical protein NTV11_03030 [Rhodocyclales bacterium]|nr:hypothetical protein [Rhodocyclales bacterium]
MNRTPETTQPIVSIPQELMLARLEQSEQMREFFIQFWLANPALAKQAGARVADLLAVAPAPTIEPGDSPDVA